MSLLKCEVCAREGTKIFVYSLPFAAMSIASCEACLHERAYPLWAIHANFDCIGGPENAADWCHSFRAWKDGKYIGWDEIVESYVPTLGCGEVSLQGDSSL